MSMTVQEKSERREVCRRCIPVMPTGGIHGFQRRRCPGRFPTGSAGGHAPLIDDSDGTSVDGIYDLVGGGVRTMPPADERDLPAVEAGKCSGRPSPHARTIGALVPARLISTLRISRTTAEWDAGPT